MSNILEAFGNWYLWEINRKPRWASWERMVILLLTIICYRLAGQGSVIANIMNGAFVLQFLLILGGIWSEVKLYRETQEEKRSLE